MSSIDIVTEEEVVNEEGEKELEPPLKTDLTWLGHQRTASGGGSGGTPQLS